LAQKFATPGQTDPFTVFMQSEQSRGIEPPDVMSQSEWLDHVIAIVNVPLLSQGLIDRLLLGGGRASIDGDVVGTIADDLRNRIASWFDLIIEDRNAVRRTLADEIAGVKLEVAKIPFACVGKRRLEVRYRIRSLTLSAALRYAIVLLLDERLGLGRRLGHCQLNSCGRFFLADVGAKGRIRRRYCTDEHMLQADRARGGERVAASREGISVAEWRARKHK
jgi:hypothetical protein